MARSVNDVLRGGSSANRRRRIDVTTGLTYRRFAQRFRSCFIIDGTRLLALELLNSMGLPMERIAEGG
jgi:hypothetical protein